MNSISPHQLWEVRRKERTMKIAMISYNRFVNKNGWVHNSNNSVYLIQSYSGKELGSFLREPIGEFDDNVNKVKGYIDNSWKHLLERINEFDTIVYYVGSFGSERILELLHENNISPEKITFVLCTCNLNLKSMLVKKYGFSSSGLIFCQCGGHNAMKKIMDYFLENGKIPNDDEVGDK
jgi:hypothetical protein